MAYFNKEQFVSMLNAKANMAIGTPAQGVYLSVVKMLEMLPDADVEAVKRGKWKPTAADDKKKV